MGQGAELRLGLLTAAFRRTRLERAPAYLH
jgi:hypothetical protein